MQITLCEDDGIFFDGVPRNVIILVKFDDGKQKRLPYPADKSISALYEDLNAIAPKVADQPLMTLPDRMEEAVDESFSPKPKRPTLPPPPAEHTYKQPATVDKSNVIEKEDIVTLIRLDEGRSKDATCDLVVGSDYRVICVISTGVTLPGDNNITKIAQGYDVVNDKSQRPERTRVFPHEVVLKSKRQSPIIKKELTVSEILDCPLCATQNDLVLEGNAFKGVCVHCRADINIERIIKKCLTDKCGNDVSCLDVGGLYKGKCNKCLSELEVPYV